MECICCVHGMYSPARGNAALQWGYSGTAGSTGVCRGVQRFVLARFPEVYNIRSNREHDFGVSTQAAPERIRLSYVTPFMTIGNIEIVPTLGSRAEPWSSSPFVLPQPAVPFSLLTSAMSPSFVSTIVVDRGIPALVTRRSMVLLFRQPFHGIAPEEIVDS